VTTYAVTPLVFVGVSLPDVSPIADLHRSTHVGTAVTRGVGYVSEGIAVLVASDAIARGILLGVGLTPDQADERLAFARRSMTGE
jgi:hypothetical protein